MTPGRRRQKSQEGLYRLLVDSIRDYAVFALDLTGHVLTWNTGAQRLKGYSAQEIIGRHFSIFYPPEEREGGRPEAELETATRDGRYEEEGWRVRKDGSRFWANVILTPLWDDKGKISGFAKITRDLTERRDAQEKAIADARRLAEIEVANRTKSEFLASMSHELRTPLNAIGGYTELLELGVGGPLTGQQREYLRRVRGSQQHLLGIISDLLNYSRIEAGQVTYDIQVIEARTIVDDVLPLVGPQAAARELTLEHNECAADIFVTADRTKAEQIVLNLLSNAVKFTPARGAVTVQCEASGDRVSISVRDTGPGIPDDKRDAIFEPFVQLGRSLTSLHEGTGLGLAISRDMARAMGGEILLESVAGSGSRFTLELPRADRPA